MHYSLCQFGPFCTALFIFDLLIKQPSDWGLLGRVFFSPSWENCALWLCFKCSIMLLDLDDTVLPQMQYIALHRLNGSPRSFVWKPNWSHAAAFVFNFDTNSISVLTFYLPCTWWYERGHQCHESVAILPTVRILSRDLSGCLHFSINKRSTREWYHPHPRCRSSDTVPRRIYCNILGLQSFYSGCNTAHFSEVDCPSRDNKTLDLLYANVKET